MKHPKILAAGLLVAALATSVLAGINFEAYQAESSTSAYRSSISAADNPAQLSDTAGSNGILSTVGQITTLTVAGCPTYEVSGRFSGASATMVVHFARYNWDGSTLTFQSSSEGTLTADATVTADGTNYVSNSLYFDTGGSKVVKVVVEAPSAGSVDLWARKVGFTQ